MSAVASGPGFAVIDRRDRVSVALSVGVHVLFALGLVALAGQAAKRYREVQMDLARTRREAEPPPPPPAPPPEVQRSHSPRARLVRRAKQTETPPTQTPVIDPGPPVEGASDNAMPALAAPPPVDPNASADGVLGGTGTAPPSESAGNRVYDMGDLDALPELVGACQPDMPAFARQTRQSGWVMLQFTLDAQGRPQGPRVRAGQPPGVFDAAALEGIRRCRYTVPRVGGRPVSVTFRQRITFRAQ